MSAPVLISIAAATLTLALPIVTGATALDASIRAARAADAAALAAADASLGWVRSDPCDLAGQVARAARSTLEQCDIDAARGEARITVSGDTVFGQVTARARAGPPQE